MYGPKYKSAYEEGIRKNIEKCHSVQNFMVTHSLGMVILPFTLYIYDGILGGGTGSGVGTYMLKLLHDLYPKICRFSVCVFPSGKCIYVCILVV